MSTSTPSEGTGAAQDRVPTSPDRVPTSPDRVPSSPDRAPPSPDRIPPSPDRAPTLRDRIADGRVHVLDGAMGTRLYDRGVFVNVCYDALAAQRPELVRELHREYVEAGAGILETNTFGANPVKLSSYGLEDRTEELNRAAARVARQAAGREERTGDSAAPGDTAGERDGRGGGDGHGGRDGPGGGTARGADVSAETRPGRHDVTSGSAERALPVHVVGAIGPLGIRIEPWGPTSAAEAEAHFRRQVQGLLDGGVDGFCLETFADLHELEAAFRAVRSLSDLPVIAQVTVGQDGVTPHGTSAADAARRLTELGADVIGLNCSVGPAAILDAMEVMAAHTDLPLSAQPNAGLPRTVRDRKIYMASPEYMAQYARRLIDAGVRFVGGCCGTTPDHIHRIAEVVRSLQPRHAAVRVGNHRADHPEARPPVPLAERSELGRRLAEGAWITTAELLPPRGWDAARFLEKAARLGEAGLDAVSLVDSPRSRSRMGAIAAGMLLQRERERTGGPRRPQDSDPVAPCRIPEPVVHYTCRDRNMMGMVADLLGAAAGGIRNLLLVSGDPPVQGPYPDSTAVFDIDSIGLTNVVRGLNRGLDPGGGSIGGPTPFVVGVAANPGAVDLEREVERFMWKVDAGAELAVTQPVFDPEALARFLERTAEWPVPVVAGLWPLASVRNAEYLAHEVPGIVVPDRVIERMRRAAEAGERAARAEGVAIAREMLEAVRGLERVVGVTVSAPDGDVDAVAEVLEGSGG